MTSFWSIWIVLIVALNIVGCVWLLWWTGRKRPNDPAAGSTSHIWDGDLTEYNNPMPRWWINLFYLTIVFAIGYLVWYPGLGSFAGTSKWTSRGQLADEQAAAEKQLNDRFARYATQPIDAIARDPAAVEAGRSLFANHCAMCHGSDARGAKGFPNLTDTIWHWGGTPQDIATTVLDGRQAAMPALATAIGDESAITEVAVYVQSLSGQSVDPGLAQAGQARFALCAACHGPDGKGNSAIGAPNLTDNYWLYGNGIEDIRSAVHGGHNGMMPAHRVLLGEMRSRLAAAYVWSLSHPPAGAAP